MKRKAFKTALPYTVPIFAGSAEFVAVNLLLGAFNPIQAFFTIYPISGCQTGSNVYQVSWKCIIGSSLWTVSCVLPEKCKNVRLILYSLDEFVLV